MAPRFYAANLNGQTVELDESESHHALHVLRLQPGDPLELFDGSGGVAQAAVDSAGRKHVVCVIQNRTLRPGSARPTLTVAAAPPRGDRLKSMVEKMTELGVDAFIPLRTVRSVVDPRQARLEKLRSTVITAMKQCGRNQILDVREPSEFSAVLRASAAEKRHIFLAHPGDGTAGVDTGISSGCVLFVGPEGGFTSEEVLQARDYGAQILSWPEGILRIETAALTFSTLLLSRLRSGAENHD